jgi:hypothetical protein
MEAMVRTAWLSPHPDGEVTHTHVASRSGEAVRRRSQKMRMSEKGDIQSPEQMTCTELEERRLLHRFSLRAAQEPWAYSSLS